MDGLIIKKEWLDKIFDEGKDIEVRGSNTKKRGKVGLIQSKSGMLMGEANLFDTFNFVDYYHFKQCRWMHFVQGQMPYKDTWGWRLKEIKRYKKPIRYIHPQGAVIWVKDVL